MLHKHKDKKQNTQNRTHHPSSTYNQQPNKHKDADTAVPTIHQDSAQHIGRPVEHAESLNI